MAKSKLVGLTFEAWNDVDRVVDGLTPDDAVKQWDEGSSFAWTLAHVTNQVDIWINVRFQKRTPHPLLGQQRFRFGGSGAAEEWDAIQEAVQEVREAARTYLDGMVDEELTVVVPFDGAFTILRETGLSLQYALSRVSAHHYFHIGEIAAKRDRLGHQVGDYPGILEECI